jgi:hypothetical protein
MMQTACRCDDASRSRYKRPFYLRRQDGVISSQIEDKQREKQTRVSRQRSIDDGERELLAADNEDRYENRVCVGCTSMKQSIILDSGWSH